MPKSIQSILRAAAKREKKKTKQRRKKNTKQKSNFKTSNHNEHKNSKQTNNNNNNKSSSNNSFKIHLKKLHQKQINRKLFSSKQSLIKKQKQKQRTYDINRNRKPKTLEYLKSKKSGDPRQVKGFKSKLTILQISYYKQQESNEEQLPFRDSYFAAKINGMSAINRSLEMKLLQNKLGPLCVSLPHVLLHKKTIFDTIIQFINNEAHKHILRDAVSLLIELAKDIRKEFMPFIDDLLLFLVEMLEWKLSNVINLQTVFSALSLLFKYLQKYMDINDIKKYYKTYFVRFLGNNNYFVRDFMAEVFGSVFKSKIMLNYEIDNELNDNDKILILKNDILSVHILDYLFDTKQLKDNKKTRQNLQIGLSVFLFQIIRGILKGFHSKTIEMLPLILNVLRRQRIENKKEIDEIKHQMIIFKEFVDLSAVYTNNKHCLEFFTPLFTTLNTHLLYMQKTHVIMDMDKINDNNMEIDEDIINEFVNANDIKENNEPDDNYTFFGDLDYLNRLLLLFNIWISHNVGEVVPISGINNIINLIQTLTNKKWINIIYEYNNNNKDVCKQLYIEYVIEIIVSCCKIYIFKSHNKFRNIAQNGIKILLNYCKNDTKMIQFIIDRLGGQSILLDYHMRKYLIQWIEQWSNNHKNDNEMNVFLELIKKTLHKKGFDLNENSNIINKVKDIMKIKNNNNNNNENNNMDNIFGKYNVNNVCRISYEQSNQIQQYLPMITHFPNKIQWINGIYNLVNVLIDYILKRHQNIEDYRFALLNKLHNVLIELLIGYFNEKNNFNTIKLPQIINNLDIHWKKWFVLIEMHSYNSFILAASLNFIEFIQSFYLFLNDQNKSELNNENMNKFKDTINMILNKNTFNKYYKLLLPYLYSANRNNRRNAIDILCLYNPEIRFNSFDNYGSKILRKPILNELKDILHNDWGPSVDRQRENKVVNIISFAKGIEPLLYYNNNKQNEDVFSKIQSKQNGIKLGERINTFHEQKSDTNKYNAEINDYQLQIVFHIVFGLLRINYRPLWSHSIELLNILSIRFPKTLWKIYYEILSELMIITHIRRDIAENLNYKQELLINKNKSLSSRPLQLMNMLFEQINKNHEFAARHIGDIVHLFIYFVDNEYHLAFPHEAMAGNYGLNNNKNIKIFDWSGKNKCFKDSSKIRVISKLRNFLGLFSNLSIDYHEKLDENMVNNLRDTFYRLLLLRELDIQKMTLASYVRFYPQIAQYYSNELRKEAKELMNKKGIENKKMFNKSKSRHRNCSLQSLLKLNTLRAGLVNFNMIRGDIRCSINDMDRPYIIPIIIRILYNKLFEHQKRKVKSSVSSRRKAILTYISTLETDEINAFLEILHHSFIRWMIDINKNDNNMNKCSLFAPGFAAQHQYITIIFLWQKCAPMSMCKHLNEICKYLTIMFKHSFQFFMHKTYRNKRTFTDNEEEMCYRNYNVCLDILRLFIQYYSESISIRLVLKDWMQYIRKYLYKQLPEIKCGNRYDNINTIWSLWKSVSRNIECCNFFDLEWPLELILLCIESEKLSTFTRTSSLKILRNLIRNKDLMRPLFIKYSNKILHSIIYLITHGLNNKLPKTELNILVYLSDVIENKNQLQQLTDSLMPYLIKCKRSTFIVPLLQVLTKLMKNILNYQTWADVLCDMLNSVNHKLGRSLLCQLLVNIYKKAETDEKENKNQINTVKWLKLVAPTLLDLNCVYIEEITGNTVPLNLRRLRAYDYLSSDLLPQLNFQQLKLITSTILYDIGHTQNDSSMEIAAIDALKSIIEYDYINHKHLNEKDLIKLIDTFINDFILKSIHHNEYRNKFLGLLAVICESRPNLNGNLHILLIDVITVIKQRDVFTLIASKEESDQIEAMQLLKTFLKPNNENNKLILNDRAIIILLPIIRSFVYIKDDLGNECRAEALNIIGAMSSCACWVVYKWMIDKFMNDYENFQKHKYKKTDKIVALECIMRISKRFHFNVDCANNLIKLDEILLQRQHKDNIWESIDKNNKNKQDDDHDHDDDDIKMEQESDNESKHSDNDNDNDNDNDIESEEELEADILEEEIFTSTDDAIDIQIYMYDHILAPLMDELRKKTKKMIDSSHVHILSRVARTVIYIGKYLPESDFEDVFLTSVSTSCQFLSSRIPIRRDKARKILCDILKSIGCKFFQYIVKEIEARTIWGRWKHILGYSICDILSEIYKANIITIGALDHSITNVTNILLHDIAGAIGAEKILETRKYRGKEASDSRAEEGFEIISKYVTFNPHIHLILHPIAEFAKRSTDRTDWRLEKVSLVLNAIKKGLINNKSINMNDLISFNYRMIIEQLQILNEGNNDDEDNNKKLLQPSDLKRNKQCVTPYLLAAPNRVCLQSATSEPKPSAILITKFCLELILLIFDNFEWKLQLTKYNIKQLELIPNLCLKVFNECPSEDTHIYVLKIAIKLLPYKLSTFAAFSKVVIEYALEAITRTDLKIKDCALLLLSYMIQYEELKLDNNMLDVILNYIRIHIQTHICPRGAINLLDNILNKKLLSPQIYDLMYEIHANLSKLQSTKLTYYYSECLTKFLLSYPLSDIAIKKHFNKIIGSLQHPFVLGRLCSLQLMDKIILSFPIKVIDIYGLVFFVSLIQQLSNENDKRIKYKIKKTLIILLNKIENDQFWEFWTMFEEWIKCKKFKLSLASLQSGIAFLSVNQNKHIITKNNYKSLCKILINYGLNDAIKQHKSNIKIKDYGQNIIWKPAYLSLVLIENIYMSIWKYIPNILFNNNNQNQNIFKNAFENVIILMDFPHRWIRIISCRILGFYLSIIGKNDLIFENENDKMLWINSNENNIYMLCEKLLIILRDMYISNSLCKQVIKNLLFLILILHEKYLNKNNKWIKELKQKQQDAYKKKLNQRNMSKKELKLMRKKIKKDRIKEIKKMRKEKADWFNDFDEENNDQQIKNDIKQLLENKQKEEKEEKNEDDDDDDNIVENDLWITESLQFNEISINNKKKEKESNWRINSIFDFMTSRIQCDGTSLDIQYFILEWFMGIIIKFTPYDLRLYDYYIITGVVYILKERTNPEIAIELQKQYAFIEGREFIPLNLRQIHKIETYKKCINLSNEILNKLKDKIGDSQFLNKFYKIKQKRYFEKKEKKRIKQRIKNKNKRKNNYKSKQPPNKKRKINNNNRHSEINTNITNDNQNGNDWVSFLWS